MTEVKVPLKVDTFVHDSVLCHDLLSG